MFRMPRALAMARAPYGPTQKTYMYFVHVLVVDRGWWWVHEKPHELGRARDRTHRTVLWFSHRENQESGPARRRNSNHQGSSRHVQSCTITLRCEDSDQASREF